MKTLLLALFILISIPNTKSIIGTYKIIDEVSEDTLEINKNGTYIYEGRGDSCWMWYDLEGQWEINNNNLVLIDKREYEEGTSIIREIENKNPSNKIIIKVITTDKKPIPNFTLNLESADYKTQPQISVTNDNGIAEFKKFTIVYDEFDNSSLSYKYKVGKREISSNSVVWRNSDSIYLTINYEPKIIKETLKHEFKIKGNELELAKSQFLIEGKKYKKL